LRTLIATARAVITVKTVPTVLSDGIHAGTGADDGMPLHVANKRMVQNVNNARLRLYNERFINCSMKWNTTASPTRPNQTKFRLPEYHQAMIACVMPRTGVCESNR